MAWPLRFVMVAEFVVCGWFGFELGFELALEFALELGELEAAANLAAVRLSRLEEMLGGVLACGC